MQSNLILPFCSFFLQRRSTVMLSSLLSTMVAGVADPDSLAKIFLDPNQVHELQWDPSSNPDPCHVLELDPNTCH